MYAFIHIDAIDVHWRTQEPPHHTGAWRHHGNVDTTVAQVLNHLREYYGVNQYDVRNCQPAQRPVQPLLHEDLAWLAVECGLEPKEYGSNKHLAGAIRQSVQPLLLSSA